MKSKSRSFAMLAATLVAATFSASAFAAAANVVVVRPADAAQARANLEASMAAAARGESVGMLTGKANPQAVTAADGSVAQELDASTMVYSVARRRADGSIEMVCVTGSEAADKALKTPAASKPFARSMKEQMHVTK